MDNMTKSTRWTHVGTIALGSFLLFLVQPMVARMALPRLGGSPAVWNSAMFVYQTLLLAGYAYAHLLSRRSARTQGVVHIALIAIAALWLPIGLSETMTRDLANPVLWTPAFITASIGPLFLMVSAQAPLIQRWYASHPGANPYPLYAASNLGSMTGLLCYPFVLEPLTDIQTQRAIWTIGYVMLGIATATCAWSLRSTPDAGPPPRIRLQPLATAKWILVAAIPSGLMLSTTTILTTDVVATPMLWVLPLVVYLASFVAAFSGRQKLIDAANRSAPLLILVEGGLAMTPAGQIPSIMIPLGLMTLYAVSVALHGRLWETKPSPDRLTGFYLAMSFGGALGGLFCAVAAPALFNWVWEHPILLVAAALTVRHEPFLGVKGIDPRIGSAMAAACVVLAAIGTQAQQTTTMVTTAAVAALALMVVNVVGRRGAFTACLICLMAMQGNWRNFDGEKISDRFRSYFGSYRILEIGDMRVLLNGTTTHGVQRMRPIPSDVPLSYYGPRSGVGRVLTMVPDLYGPQARVAVVGLGVGTLSCYRRPGQTWQFNEIDPDVVRVATDVRKFTYVHDCAPDARMVTGDARLTLGQQREGSLDALVLDAFSSDAIPMHLMTREAFADYGRIVGPHGVLVVHITNRVLDLEPVLAATPGWTGAALTDIPNQRVNPYEAESHWIVMSRDPARIATVMSGDDRWRDLRARRGFAGWTDDRASILPLIENF